MMFSIRPLSNAGRRSLYSSLRQKAWTNNARRYVHWEKVPESEQVGYDKHGLPVSKSESVLNRYTGTFFGTVFVIVAYHYFNKSYMESHHGDSLLTIIKKGNTLEELKANYDSYRQGVMDREKLHTMFADTPVVDANNYVTHISEVPGKVQCFNTNAQFNTIQNWEEVGPRKQREDPFH